MDIQFQLDDSQSEVFTNIGELFAVSEVDANQAVEDFARAVEISIEVDGQMVKKPDYYLWVAGSDVVKLAYAKKIGLDMKLPRDALFDSDSIKSMWKRFTARLESNYGLTKPASPEISSQKKAEQRSKAQAEMDVLKQKSIQELQAEIDLLTKKATKENLKKAGKLASAIEAKNKDALKDRMDAIKELQSEVIKAVKACLDEVVLTEALGLLVDNDARG
jgi:hypothetical protein